jgi:ParB-like chromosome segregation protein Spo0J
MADTIDHIDPSTLVVDTNFRTSAAPDNGFVDSIRENGVLTPIFASRDTDGVVKVRAGQRRTLAAREARLTTVPVFVVDQGGPGLAAHSGMSVALGMATSARKLRAGFCGADRWV